MSELGDNRFDFYITNDEDINVKFDYFKIIKKNAHYIIHIKNLEKDVRSMLFEGSEYFISDGIYLMISFRVIKNSLNEENVDFKNIKIIVDSESSIQLYSNNFYANLVYSWKKNESSYHWSDFKSEFKRRVWIYACSRLKSVNTEFISNGNIYIDLENINSESEMYCYLGEVFFGYRGYIGNNLSAFKDCLLDVKDVTNVKIIFRDKMKQTETAKKYNINYGDEILNILDYHEIKYEILN
ncbi:barstar family protein [Tenacibaculum maritimum]|uniref:Barstar (barnase inhibitor) domain-containing protein n=1 Tax=Tenacibaculum maritimum NCIMB 2154 TaxID=1349785 RepID=A0A2H1EDF2_9FLAO|nr:barstar family protein [Tenacibaculum maritimum]MCD9586258.1 barstar family protein [Tenacibaculum maritimum]MCD9620610.1 barstar family protein [Tenacibaculum maritimum]MCD9626013.1 barstar family protein [Tenacibaculum maritimum]MCD9631447.1 barstar family protein [Tenacibaculum maritimum]MCD9634403.1 barstar family protein [Tenacibaculum maritimum]